MNILKIVVSSVAMLAATCTVQAQLTVEECYELAWRNYPQVNQYGLINRSEEYNLSNASKGYLPQFSLSAQATYQTDVTSIGSIIPESLLSSLGDGVTLPNIPKDQYQILGEVSQVIWDGGTIRAAQDGIMAQGDVDRAQFEVNMYGLRDRINSLFFGILLIDEQLRLNDIYMNDLQANYDRVKSYEDNGVASASDLDAVRVEQVTARQNEIQLKATRSAYINMLSAFIGEPLDTETELVRPVFERQDFARPILRPELDLYDAMARQANARRSSIKAGNMPRLGLFVQGGYGNPGLNMFKDKFTAYAIGGVRLTWNFGNMYTRKNDLLTVDNTLRNIGVQRETFLFNTDLQQKQFEAEYDKYLGMIAEDADIIRMRENIRRASEAKLEYGTISVPDLIRDLNAERNARVNMAVHEVEMLQTIYGIKNLTNN